MDEQFQLPVDYKGREHLFNATLNVYGYTHKFQVEVNNLVIIFEPDEERNYRAVLGYDKINDHKNIDIELLKKIAEALETIVK